MDISAHQIGSCAKELSAQEQDASVVGLSRHGTFLRLASGWVIFLSYESFRGPLTVNIGEDARDKLRLEVGVTARVNPDYILFPTLEARFMLRTGRVWQVPPPALVASTPAQRLARLEEVALRLFARGKTSRVGSALEAFLGFRDEAALEAEVPLKTMIGVRSALERGDPVGIAGALQALCGMGTGLTPSGDDLIMGLILALNRWRDTLASDLDLEELNSEVIKIAYQGTTSLAANLIECASRGGADERLLLALDGILTGEPPSEECATYLTRWGNSSGLDALAGMGLAILAP